MKKITATIITILISISSFSQIKFEKGYFITNNGTKTDCLIKNADWRHNPSRFDYKLSEASETKVGLIDSILEFGILNANKYKRFEVEIDQSSEDLTWLSKQYQPEFNNEIVFLKVIFEGKFSLLQYEAKGLTRFFISNSDTIIEQLIYKKYFIYTGLVSENSNFKSQLELYLNCTKINFKTLNYNYKELVNAFALNNDCSGTSTKSFVSPVKKSALNLYVTPGINSNNADLYNSMVNHPRVNFKNQMSYRIGVEAELVLPYNKNKLALYAEPAFRAYTSETEYLNKTTTLKYNSIEITAGFRYYLHVNSTSKAFINAGVIKDISLASSITSFQLLDLTVNSNLAASLGFGFRKNNKYSLEIRYSVPRQILNKYAAFNSKFEAITLIFGYRLVGKN